MAEVTIISTPNLQWLYLTPHFNDNNINDNNDNENDNDDNNLISFISLKNIFDWQRYQILNVNVSEKKKDLRKGSISFFGPNLWLH